MSYESAAPSNNEYFRQLQADAHRGRLLAETVLAGSRAAMIEDVVSSELQGGLYIEIGFGGDPYAAMTPRTFTESSRYVGVDGGVSDYYLSDTYGWGAADGPYSDGIWERASQKLVQSGNAPHAALVRGDAQHMPLPNAAKAQLPVREIYLGDVLITPGVHHRSQLLIH